MTPPGPSPGDVGRAVGPRYGMMHQGTPIPPASMPSCDDFYGKWWARKDSDRDIKRVRYDSTFEAD